LALCCCAAAVTPQTVLASFPSLQSSPLHRERLRARTAASGALAVGAPAACSPASAAGAGAKRNMLEARLGADRAPRGAVQAAGEEMGQTPLLAVLPHVLNSSRAARKAQRFALPPGRKHLRNLTGPSRRTLHLRAKVLPAKRRHLAPPNLQPNGGQAR